MKGIETPCKKLILATLALLITSWSFASHIVGGEMSYKCLGGDYYQITLRYYRDCGGVQLPPTVDIKIANQSGTVVQTHATTKGPSSFLNVDQPGCGAPTPTICIETADYVVASVHLPGGPSSYVIYNQECCRNNSLDNVVNAWKVGATFPAYMYPSSTLGCNNSPDFGAYPPVALPLNVPLNIPISATDVDGDSLFFELCSPLSDVNATAPFAAVPFAPGYSSSNMVPASPALSIDPATGVLSGTPTQLGKFAIGICVNEYRNGVLIGKVRRDYQFTVITPWALFATITAQTDAACGSGGSATVTAAGAAGPYTYLWSNNATTATVNNLPAGTHSVIVSNGSCSDTATVIIKGRASFTTNITHQTTLACGATSGASATIAISGGVPPYSVVWPNGPGGMTNNQLGLGANKVVIADNANCTDTLIINIAQSGANIVANIDSLKAASCATAANGYVSLSGNGGVAPYSFLWNDLATAPTRNNLLPGQYGVKVTDAKGCSDSIAITVPMGPGITLSWDSIQTIRCAGVSSGYLRPKVSGGAAPYSYVWNTNATTPLLSGLPAGNYILTVSDAGGCTESISYDLIEPDSLWLSIKNLQTITCHGDSSAAVEVEVYGGTKPYSYSWNNGTTAALNANLSAGTYTVTVEDANACVVSMQCVVTEPQALHIQLDSVEMASCGLPNGSAEISVSGGVLPYSVVWGNNVVGKKIAGVAAGVYTVFVVDSKGCEDSLQVVVPTTSAVTLTVDSVFQPSCGASNGFIGVSASGGVGPYTYSWSTKGNAQVASNLSAGSYTVKVTDGHNCTESITVNLAASSAPVITLQNLKNPTCGGINGEITISISGGNAPYSVLWNTNDTMPSISNLPTGNYSVAVSDNDGCVATAQFSLSTSTPVVLNIDTVAPASCGLQNGMAAVSVSGGAAPYSVFWSNGQIGMQDNSLASGTYLVYAVDSNGCTDSILVQVQNLSGFSALLDSVVSPMCFGANNGFAKVVPQGGQAPYTFLWSNGSTADTAMQLTSGNHFVVLQDAAGCKDSIHFVLSSPHQLQVSVDTLQNPSCFGSNEGKLSIDISGGNAPYKILWSTLDTVSTLNNLGSGSYGVTVTDSRGCSSTASFTLSDPDSLQIILKNVQHVNCHGSADGAIHVSVKGGQAPYSFSWGNTPQQDSSVSGLQAGNYVLNVTDANGCAKQATYFINEPQALSLVLDTVLPETCGQQNGSATISVTGGVAPYSVLWSSNHTSNSVQGLAAGVYTAWVTDANGCSDSVQVSLPGTSSFTLSIDSVKTPLCAGSNTGFAKVKITGGKAPFSYSWSNGSVADTAHGLNGGFNYVLVSDAQGCEDSLVVDLAQPDSLIIELQTINNALCNGLSGNISVDVNGGQAPYSILWSNNVSGKDLLNVKAGTYSVNVVDAKGCAASATYTVSEPDSFIVVVDSIKHPSCPGASDGEVFLRATGNNSISSIAINYGKVNPGGVTNLSAGNYTVFVMDSAGCGVNVSFEIKDPEPLVVKDVNVIAPGCDPNDLGFIELAVSGGVAPYSYQWQDGLTTLNRYSVGKGSYQLTVTDAAGCSVSRTFEFLTKDITLNVNIEELTCVSYTDAEVEISVTGAAKPFRLKLNGKSAYEGKMNLQHGNYVLTVTDAEGCTVSHDFTIEEQSGPKIFLATAFTPDGDGINDSYIIKGSEECFTNATLEVFNRWGGKVYETTQPFVEFWDGTVNGVEAKSDAYLYSFKSDQLVETGYFNIIR